MISLAPKSQIIWKFKNQIVLSRKKQNFLWIYFCACVDFMRIWCMIGRFEWVVGTVWFPFHSSWVCPDVMYIQEVISKHIKNIIIFSYTINGVKRTLVISKIKLAWNCFILKTSSWCFVQNRGNGICIDKWSCI